MHSPQKPYILHAPAATPPNLVAHQCITLSEHPYTPAKPFAAANTQYNQSAVQYSTEPKVQAPPSVPATKVPASSASLTSMGNTVITNDVPEHLFEQKETQTNQYIVTGELTPTILIDHKDSYDIMTRSPWAEPDDTPTYKLSN